MNNQTNVKNFYEEEAEYEKSILLTKDLIKKIIYLNIDEFKRKIEIVDKESEYRDFIDLFIAVIGKKTNKYYYHNTKEYINYDNLEQGKVYKMSMMNGEIKSKNKEEKVLELEARGQLVPLLYDKVLNLKKLFSQNIKVGDGYLSTIENTMILENDVEYLDNLLKYLELMNDKTGRLKVFVAERDIYAYEEAKEEYNKKTSIEKFFHKMFNTEESTIESMAKNKQK